MRGTDARTTPGRSGSMPRNRRRDPSRISLPGGAGPRDGSASTSLRGGDTLFARFAMKSADRRALIRLPVTALPWEVAFFAPPPGVDRGPFDGLLVVVEESCHAIRWFGPVAL